MAQLGEQKCKVWQFKRMCFVSVWEQHLRDNICMKMHLWDDCAGFSMSGFRFLRTFALLPRSPVPKSHQDAAFLGQEMELEFAEQGVLKNKIKQKHLR